MAMPAANSNRGFTLIELLLVLVIIAVMAGFAVLGLGSNPAKLVYQEAKRLQLVMQLAADEAMMQGIELALGIGEEGYQILLFDSEASRWQIIDEKPFQYHPFGEQISHQLQLEGEWLDEAAMQQIKRLQAQQHQQDLQPTVLFFSSGEVTPFVMRLRHETAGVESLVSSDGISEVMIN